MLFKCCLICISMNIYFIKLFAQELNLSQNCIFHNDFTILKSTESHFPELFVSISKHIACRDLDHYSEHPNLKNSSNLVHMRQFPTREASNKSSQVKNALHKTVSLLTCSISIDPKDTKAL